MAPAPQSFLSWYPSGEPVEINLEMTLEACTQACIGGNFSAGAHGSIDAIGGLGLDDGLVFQLGVSANKPDTFSVGGECKLAAGVGGYGATGENYDNNQPWFEGGVQVGGDAGCAADGTLWSDKLW
jgi:hypothetical protein